MKKKIIIASVLKPTDDVRMYEKFANSIAKCFPNEFEIHILGAQSNRQSPVKPSNEQEIQEFFFHPIAQFDRLSSKRFKYSKTFLINVFKINPSLLIINSPELLLAALLVKMKLKIPIIYDVRENYFFNILYQPTYKNYLRPFLATAVRSLEHLSRLWIDFYLLAERCYEKEFSFAKGKSEIIENKYKPLSLEFQVRSSEFKIPSLNFLYTGTISPTYGTINAIRFVKKIKIYFPESQLVIKGFCADKHYLKLLKTEAEDCGFINLEISEVPINHQEIIATFEKSDIALLPYLPNKSTENCIPAKMYEYIAHSLPMVVQKNALWESICLPCKAALFIDFEEENIEKLVHDLAVYPFYSEGNKDFAFWESEEKKLIPIISKYINDEM